MGRREFLGKITNRSLHLVFVRLEQHCPHSHLTSIYRQGEGLIEVRGEQYRPTTKVVFKLVNARLQLEHQLNFRPF